MLSWQNPQLKVLADKARELLQSSDLSERAACEEVVKHTPYNADSVRKILQRDAKPKEKDHGNQLLTDLEELTLVGVCLAFAQRGIGFSQKGVIDMVREQKGFGADWDGGAWARGFFKRHNTILTKRQGQKTEEERIVKVTKEDMMEFADHYDRMRSQFSFQAQFVINVDESPVAPMNPTMPAVASSPKAEKVNHVYWKRDALRTVVPFLGADGTVWMVVLIFSRVHGSENKDSKPVTIVPEERRTTRTYPVYYASTEKGYMNKILWAEVMKEFVAILSPQLNGAAALLFLDHLASHEQAASLSLLLKNNIHPLFFPAHASHILQPADNVVFAGLKQQVLAESLKKFREYVKAGKQPDSIVQEVILIALKKSLTGDAIRRSFENTSIFPWDRHKFAELVRKNVLDAPESAKSPDLPRPVIDAKNIVLKQFASVSIPKKIRSKGIRQANKLYRGEDVMEFRNRQDEEKEQLEKKRQLKIEQKNEKKRKRIEEECIRKKSQIKCLICKSVYRGGSSWWKCRVCHDILLCHGCSLSPYATAHEDECDGE